MAYCKNCDQPIADGHSTVQCVTCNQPLHKECAINDGASFCDGCYITKTEEAPTLQFEVPSVIRRSYIELYKACPFKFYNEIILGMESPKNIYSQMGIDLHTLFDKACQDKGYVQRNMLIDFGTLINGYDSTLYDVPWDIKQDKMDHKGLNSIVNFYNVLAGLPQKPFATEETIQFSIGEGLPLVQTTSDRIDLIDGELEMLDWKTGKVMVGQKISTDLQAPLYIHGVREKYGIPIRKFTFHYLDENKTRIFTRTNNDEYVCTVGKREYYINITDAIREVQSLFSHIKRGNFNIPNNIKGMYFTCKLCHLQDLGVCKGADIQAWKQFN